MAQILFDPQGFTAPQAKKMPVILVLDNSGSMSGEKIDSLNKAVHDMLDSFRSSACADAAFDIAIVTFGTGIHLFQKMEDVSSIRWRDIAIGDTNSCRNLTGQWDDPNARGTPLGATLKIVKSMIEDKTIIPSRAYRPAVILVSDGHPTDSWNAALQDFVQNGRSSKCDRWAMAIGRDADAAVLGKFIDGAKNPDGSPRILLYAKDSGTLRDNFKFITMSVTNTVAVASKSKVLTVQPVSVKATGIEARGDHGAPEQTDTDPSVRTHNGNPAGQEEESDSGFEW